MNHEVRERLEGIADNLHRSANPGRGIRQTVAELKRDIREARDSIRLLVEEFTT